MIQTDLIGRECVNKNTDLHGTIRAVTYDNITIPNRWLVLVESKLGDLLSYPSDRIHLIPR